MQNSTLWADVAHPIFIGIHGNVENPEILENLNYINIDILDHKEKQLDYQGCLAINTGDNNLIRNVRFENIRIEDFRQGQLVNLRIFFNEKYCKAPGRGIENILFKDISYTGKDAEVSMIIGYDKERKVKNIRFENLTINGEVIYDDMPEKPNGIKLEIWHVSLWVSIRKRLHSVNNLYSSSASSADEEYLIEDYFPLLCPL